MSRIQNIHLAGLRMLVIYLESVYSPKYLQFFLIQIDSAPPLFPFEALWKRYFLIMWELRSTYKIFVGKLKEEITRNTYPQLDNNIKMDII